MAYSRFSFDCDWYVFWETSKAEMDAEAIARPKPKSEELLSVWCARIKERPSFRYVEVREMLESGDFSCIPGFEENSRTLLHECMTEFVRDVDRDHGGTA